MKLIFLRHGQTDWNAKGLIQGRTDVPLNDAGRAQATALEFEHIDAIYCSPMQRARETAEIVNRTFHLPLQTDERLTERDYGAFEGTDPRGDCPNWDELIAQHGGEPLSELHARVSSFLREIASKHKNQTILVVAHGGIGRMVQACYRDEAQRLSHCEPLHLQGAPRQWIIDRIVEKIAVLECRDESLIEIPVEDLPKDIREGSILVRYNGAWRLDLQAEIERRAKLKQLQDSIFI